MLPPVVDEAVLSPPSFFEVVLPTLKIMHADDDIAAKMH
jgi:hypothetical protein